MSRTNDLLILADKAIRVMEDLEQIGQIYGIQEALMIQKSLENTLIELELIEPKQERKEG